MPNPVLPESYCHVCGRHPLVFERFGVERPLLTCHDNPAGSRCPGSLQTARGPVLNTTVVKNALHNASPEAVRAVDFREEADNERYGRGVLVGLVSGLMAAGLSFDEAWRFCLDQNRPLAPDCIPPSWPSPADYAEADRPAVK